MAEAHTLPFTLEFVLLADTTPPRPPLQSYSWMVDDDGAWYILGGRLAGLHQFGTSGHNFPNPNQALLRVDPDTFEVDSLFDLTLLDPEIGDPLMATNQQSHFDRSTGEWLIIGGYGYDRLLDKQRTFDTLIRIPVKPLLHTLASSATPGEKAAAINALVQCQHDRFFAVTGGALRRLGSRYLLMFGQGFDGPYDPFVEVVAQQYTNAVRYFRLDPRSGTALGMGELLSAEADEPFHRRDGPVVDTINPRTGAPRVAAFGGVFPPGKLDGYLNPVYVEESGGPLVTTTDRTVTQLFNQYECPTIVVWDPQTSTVMHTFFGGISRSYYHQTPEQAEVYAAVTAEGRNDGLPFVADITTMVQPAQGPASELISPLPIPGGALHGTSADFIPVTPASLPAMSDRGVIDLSKIAPGADVVIGHIYGGIEADFPLPKIPNYGSQGTGALYEVHLVNTTWMGQIPSSQGHLAYGVLPAPSGTG